ncbi:MAG TPA: hypothetical protein VJ044_10115, partial [Candidatus Hodarchaeales archaeon]|nr:hypothetical protein [Candidatus Hodarchaeales archaeon]
FRPKRNLKESRVPSKVTTLLKKLHAPVRSILASKFRRPGQDFSPNTNFITGLAYSIIDKQGNVLIEISENFPIELVKRISMRFLASVVAKADRAMEYFGEAIIPVLETEDTVFCSFFRQAQNSDSIGILHVFARDKSALYRWAPILSDEARSISRMLAKEGPSVQARRVFFHLMTMFELAAGKHLTKSQDTTIFKNGMKLVLGHIWGFRNAHLLVEALIVNRNVFLLDIASSDEVTTFFYGLQFLSPHRSLVLSTIPEFKQNKQGQVIIVDVGDPHTLEKNGCIVSLEKKRVLVGISSNYAKRLLKSWQAINDIDRLKSEITKELMELAKISEILDLTPRQRNEKDYPSIFSELETKTDKDIMELASRIIKLSFQAP